MVDRTQPKFSVLDLALVRDGSSVSDTYRDVLDVARHVERWGYTRFWLAEHHSMPGIASAATAVLIGHIAGGTSTLRVGSGGVMLPNHAALVIAEQFGTLDALYPGRIDLGIGRAPGSDGLTARALRRDFASGTEDEFPAQVQALLGYVGPRSSHQQVRAVPGEGSNVPVWLLGSSTYSAQLAALLGLRFAFASHFAPEQMSEALDVYRGNFRPSESLSEPWAMIGIPVIAAETDAVAERLATTPYQRFLSLIRGEPLYSRPPVDDMNDIWSAREEGLVRSKMGAAIIGGPETVAGKLAAVMEETKADEVIFTSDPYAHQDRLRSYEIVAAAMKTLRAEALTLA